MFTKQKKLFGIFSILALTLVFTACGDGDSTGPGPVDTFTIGGSISGLAGQIKLRLNVDGVEHDIITLTEDGDFTFAEEVEEGKDYEVEPFGSLADCPSFSITNDSGTANGDVTTVTITCS